MNSFEEGWMEAACMYLCNIKYGQFAELVFDTETQESSLYLSVLLRRMKILKIEDHAFLYLLFLKI